MYSKRDLILLHDVEVTEFVYDLNSSFGLKEEKYSYWKESIIHMHLEANQWFKYILTDRFLYFTNVGA